MSRDNPPRIGRLKLSDAHPRRLLFLTVRRAPGVLASGASDRYHRFESARVSKWVWVGYEEDQRPAKNEIARVGPYSCRERLSVFDSDELAAWVERSTNCKIDSWLISHSLAADLHLGGCLDAIKAKRWRFDSRVKVTPDDPDSEVFAESSPGLQILNDPPTILSLRVAVSNRLIAIDSRNYWPVPLPELAESLGVDLPPEPLPGALERNVAPWLDARLRTVETAILRLISWLDTKRLGRLRFSAAGVAMQAYRTKHLPTEIHPTTDEDIRKAERSFSYGGEVRTWRIGRIAGPVYQYDVSSLYPSVMRDNQFPVRALGKIIGGPWRTAFPETNLESVAAEVFIRDYSEAWPVKTELGTRFCRGTFTTWLAGPELDEAVRKGIVLGWRSVIVYELAELFTSWVDELWYERLGAKTKGDDVAAGFAKLLLNSLYGKFGQRGGDLIQRTDFLAGEDWGRWTTLSTSTGKRRTFQCMNGVPFEEVPKKELRRAFPAISAWVTAFGRRRMRYLRWLAGRPNVFYQGVDALLVSEEGKRRLEKSEEVAEQELGKLRQLGQAEHCIIRGWGDYELGSKRVIQGIKPDAEQLSDRRFEFSVFDTIRKMMFLPGPRLIAETRRMVTLPEESIIGTRDDDGNVLAPLRREPIPEELRAALERVGCGVDFDCQQFDHRC